MLYSGIKFISQPWIKLPYYSHKSRHELKKYIFLQEVVDLKTKEEKCLFQPVLRCWHTRDLKFQWCWEAALSALHKLLNHGFSLVHWHSSTSTEQCRLRNHLLLLLGTSLKIFISRNYHKRTSTLEKATFTLKSELLNLLCWF